MSQSASAGTGGIFVSDFDGTMTRHDFYDLALRELLPAGREIRFEEGPGARQSLFDMLAEIFAAIEGDEQRVCEVALKGELDPKLSESIERLQLSGWEVKVASAGCRWYIDQLFKTQGISIEVIASPGEISPQGGLIMQRLSDSPYYSAETGIDKAIVVREALATGRRVVYAGDSRSDFEAAKLVADDSRFARSLLAQMLTEAGYSHRPFDRWSQIAETLLAEQA